MMEEPEKEPEKKTTATCHFELPKSIWLGHMEYTVIETDRLNKASNEVISTSSGNLYEIMIQADMHPAKRRSELFRHIHNNLTGIGFPGLTNPGDSALAHSVHAVLRVNEPLSREDGVPELVESGVWIFGEVWGVEMLPAHWRNSGHMNSAELNIQINSALPEGEKWETIWHEIYHTICMFLGIADKESDATTMAHLMCNFLSDNDPAWMYVDLSEVRGTAPPAGGCSPKRTLERRFVSIGERE